MEMLTASLAHAGTIVNNLIRCDVKLWPTKYMRRDTYESSYLILHC